MEGSYSIDPCVFQDDDGSAYLYFGGIWGGQLQGWSTGSYISGDDFGPRDGPALLPKMAKLNANMLTLSEAARDIQILDENGDLLLAGDNDRRFFEASWIHKYNGTYYFSYSTGDTHNIVYATGNNPYGPFTYQGVILKPVVGWTSHHSITKFKNQWYLFYHDTEISKGQTHLRNIKMTPLTHNADGRIQTINPYND